MTPKQIFDEDKPKSKSVKLSQKNIGLLAVAIVLLQVFEAAVTWFMGSSQGSQSMEVACIMLSAVIFCIAKFKYTKNSVKKEPEAAAQCCAEPEDASEQPSSRVVDTMTVKGPAEFAPRSAKTEKKNDKPFGAKWVPNWLRNQAPKKLNPKAKKFVPTGHLDSDSPAFVPKAYAKNEKDILKSKCGEEGAGTVMYRSRHWLNEICPDAKKTEKKDQVVWKGSNNAPRNSRSPVLKKSQREDIKWTSSWDVKWTSSWSKVRTIGACVI